MPSLAVVHASSLRLVPHRHRISHPENHHTTRLSVAASSRRLRPISAAASLSSVHPSGAVDSDPCGFLERCLFSTEAGAKSPSLSIGLVARPMATVSPEMMGQYGSFGAVTLEKGKLDLSQKTSKSSPETAIGGGGGDNGKKIFHGGGGGDDGDDDDDYFGDFDEGDEGEEGGLFRRRIFLQEFYDRQFVDAVLQEWYKTITDLPAGFRQACEMGMVSSAQMAQFLAMNARPTMARLISRSLPESISRAFIGRMLADPSFLYKLLLEQVATIGCSVWWEFKNRKERIKEEWDLALINVLTAAACNVAIVWSLAPCRSYGSTFQFDLQNTIQKLPNNIFERSYPFREFDLQKRVQSFFYKAAELSLFGLIAGSVQGTLSKLSSRRKEPRPCCRLSMTMPSVRTNALGSGSFLGIYTNFRYQLLYGIDRALLDYFDVLGVAIFFGFALRILNVQVGETSKVAWLGVEANPLIQSEDHSKFYSRPSEALDTPSSKWFISKNTIISGLGRLGIRKDSKDLNSSTSKARRKRIVRTKVSESSV
ncbi:protein RETICULATA-RELATED 1, chloroplastic-like isoform X1 [Dioscorea cayenensis subsp. rotundata]|uniref:Protein RETICULATA-RELATED 1, chloroplastic-like isoform X1 n=1 Tax=Dioscorea cayennensis subsp. rotundata TaxID=55577 RepID=A0AB40BKE8_DIOCR|nr:protein RETICULATA-RELATED 1, chloroplastic-like isoform X1 [Dioscorea cayenensis subsp. rotundata]